MRFARLFHQYIVRDLIENPGRTLVTLIGVALGIAVVVGVQLANERALNSFNSSLDSISGGADLQISANGLPLDERLIEDLDWVWDIGGLTAVIDGQAEAMLASGNQPVQLLGIDLLSEMPFRTYTPAEEPDSELSQEVTRSKFVDLLVDPDAVIIPQALAGELGVGIDETIALLVANQLQRFRVAAIVEDSGVARAFDGHIAFMDIAAAQWALDRVGSIDRIDVSIADGTDIDTVAERLRVQLPDSVLVYRPSDSTEGIERMTRAFRYNLTALSYIALAVGIILIYNTLNISVSRRRTEIGVLRTVGASRALIRRMFITEAISFGVVGGLAGVWIGSLLANTTGILVSRTISLIYTGTMSPAQMGPAGWDVYLQMIVLGGTLAGLSGSGPALRAMRLSPVEVLRGTGGSLHFSGGGSRWRIAGLMALGTGVALSFAPPVDGFPFPAYLAGVAFIVGFGLLCPGAAAGAMRLLRPGILRFLPVEGRLAAETIESRMGRISVAVMSLAIAVAMLTSVAIMVASFRDTVVVWIEQTLEGDLYVRPAIAGADGGRNVVGPAAVSAIAAVPGVAAIDRFRAIGIEYEGFPAILAAGEFGTRAAHGHLLFQGDHSMADVAANVVAGDRVVVSEPFAVRHDLQEGDVIVLPTPAGQVPFTVEAIFYDYSSEGGMVVMDRTTWTRRFGDTSVNSVTVYLDPSIDAEEGRQRVATGLAGYSLRIATNGELREQVLRVFDQTFEITYALELIALAVAMLGIANTMAALILERKAEIAMLRFIGAGRRQIRRVVLIEAGLIGILGSGVGLGLGLTLSWLLVYVINYQSFGWTIQFALPLGFLVQALAVVVIATVAAGLYPSTVALRLDPIRAIRAE